MHCVKGAHLTRYLSMSSGSAEQQIILHGPVSYLSLLSTHDQSNLTAACVGCRMAKSHIGFPAELNYFYLKRKTTVGGCAMEGK